MANILPYLARMNKRALTIRLAAPRGFCAGVDRAIQIVERALALHGAPVYVRHEIVHNKYVVEGLRQKGAVFIEELAEIPDSHADRPVVFSAHGVPKSVHAEAASRALYAIDATCPLVTKVHNEAERHYRTGHHLILVGHKGHPEVFGTIGQLPEGAVTLIETVADVAALAFGASDKLAYATQTTLSVDDTASVIAALKAKYPDIIGPGREDICYATTNRQDAVKAIASSCDLVLVMGAPNSSNSNRLVEVALNHGCPQARLIERAADIDWAWFEAGALHAQTLGLTAGASAPEILVEEVIEACRARFDVTLDIVTLRAENVIFRLPRSLEAA